MEIRNCKKCKKIFQYLSGPILCPSCKEEEENEFQEVKKYLRENPRASMTEISQALDISVEKINRFLKDGRLEVTADSLIKLQCESCGKEILTGRFCNTCAGKLEGAFQSASNDIKRRSVSEQKRVMNYLKKDN